MLKFFKHSGPLQFFSLFLLTLLIRLPLFFTDAPLLAEDLRHLVLGEKIASDYFIYLDLIEPVPPGSAFVYWLFGTVFGRSLIAFQFVAAILVFVQALIFRYMCNNNDLMSERGDIPAFVYIICSIVCYDFMSLSPCLISLTFILIAFDRIFRHIRSENDEGEIFSTGFYLGIAYLCFAPSAIYFIMAYLAFLLYTRTSFRYYSLLLMGFVFPVLCMATYLFYFDGLNEFLNYYVFNFPVRVHFSLNFDIGSVAIITGIMLLLIILGFFALARYNRFINYQVICQQMMFLWFIVTLGIIVLFFSKTITSFMLVLPFSSFFISHFLILTKRKKVGNVLVFLFMLNSILVIYAYSSVSFYAQEIINFNKQVSIPSGLNNVYKNKKIAVFGEDIAVLRNNKQATPYFDWELSAPYLGGMDYYSKVIHVYNGFSKDLPDVIVDQKNVVPKIFERIPALDKTYKKTAFEGVYEKR